jgi:hypothetical protein
MLQSFLGHAPTHGFSSSAWPALHSPHGHPFLTASVLSSACRLLMSVSYLDPGNLEADIQVGVQTGYDL